MMMIVFIKSTDTPL